MSGTSTHNSIMMWIMQILGLYRVGKPHTRIPTDFGNKIGERLTNHYSEFGVLRVFVRSFSHVQSMARQMRRTIVLAMHVLTTVSFIFPAFPKLPKNHVSLRNNALAFVSAQVNCRDRSETAEMCRRNIIQMHSDSKKMRFPYVRFSNGPKE